MITGFIQIIIFTKLLKLNDCSHAFISPLSILRKHVVNSTVRFHFQPADPRKQLSVNWPGQWTLDDSSLILHIPTNILKISRQKIFVVLFCDSLQNILASTHSLTCMYQTSGEGDGIITKQYPRESGSNFGYVVNSIFRLFSH